MALVTVGPKLLSKPLAKNTNAALALFDICYGRLKLHELLANVGRRVLYFDTDSVIFTTDGINDPATGE